MSRKKETEQTGTGRAVLCAILAVLIPPIGIPLAIINAIVTNKTKKTKQRQTTVQEPVERNKRYQPETRKTVHSHTPVEYSYDACASTKRLDQLNVLYKAGLYTKQQYLEARDKIMNA